MPGWRNEPPCRTIPPPMSLLALLLAAQAVARADTLLPYLAFPELGLDDPAAYEGYQTRVYQDASGNGFQVYLKSSGRVVNLWADAANESVGFSVRDSTGKPAELAWGSSRGCRAGSSPGSAWRRGARGGLWRSSRRGSTARPPPGSPSRGTRGGRGPAAPAVLSPSGGRPGGWCAGAYG